MNKIRERLYFDLLIGRALPNMIKLIAVEAVGSA